MESRRMVGTFAADEAIFGGLALAGERPFLQRRLWMLGRGDLPCDHVAPVEGDEGARGLFPLIEPQPPDHRFDPVGGDIVDVPPAVANRLRAKTAIPAAIQGLSDAPLGRSSCTARQAQYQPARAR